MKIASLIVLCAAAICAYGVDWAKVEREWQEKAALAAENFRIDDYVINSEDPTVYRGAVPELAMGLHFFNEDVAKDLAAANIVSTRHTIYWYLIENTTVPGVYDDDALAELDKTIAAYEAAGVEPNFVVHGNAPGVSFANREEGYRRFASFMEFLVSRYPQVRFWELWNEMDVAFTDLFGARNGVPMLDRGKMYAEMLKITYPRIKAANPNAVVVCGGLGHYNDFARGIYEGGGKDYFDVMNVHTYGIPVKYQFLDSGLKMRALMDEFGDADKPVWCTEFGAGAEGLTSAWGVPEEDTVAKYDEMQLTQIKTCIELNLQTRVYQKYFIYAFFCSIEGNADLHNRLREKVGDYDLNDLGYTMSRRDGSWRPAFQYIVDTNPNYEFFLERQ